jgi:hypothetical protein
VAAVAAADPPRVAKAEFSGPGIDMYDKLSYTYDKPS